MSDKKKSKKSENDKSEKLEHFDIKINEFGEVISSVNIDDVNQFLDENLYDKKKNTNKNKK